MTSVCQWHNGKCVYVRASVCVCHSSFSLSSWVQGACLAHITSIKVLSRSLPRKVTLYEPHTAEESLRRRRSGRNSQVLPGHPGQARALLHVLLPPHQGVCVKGHLLHSRVGIQLGWTPFFVIRLPLTSRTKYCVLLFDFSKTFLLVRVAWDFSLTDCPPTCWVALAFLPAATSPTVPVALFVCLAGITRVFPAPRFFTRENLFFSSFFVFWRIFFPSFQVRAGILSSCPLSDAYCCTYREDVRNRLPLCQG
jgi:hypothetical protein